MTFGEKVEHWIRRRRMTQGSVAKKIGLAQSGVSELISGERNPSFRQAIALSALLGVPLDYLADDAMAEEPAPRDAGATSPDEAIVLAAYRGLRDLRGLAAEAAVVGMADVAKEVGRTGGGVARFGPGADTSGVAREQEARRNEGREGPGRLGFNLDAEAEPRVGQAGPALEGGRRGVVDLEGDAVEA